MKRSLPFTILLTVLLAPCLFAAENDTNSKTLKSRDQRGTLADRTEKVRGDSGKWRDDSSLQAAPPLAKEPAKLSLDAWADQLAEKPVSLTSGEESWLIFRTEQLDDNDRLWIEKIEQQGNRITIVLNHAVWQGDYSKNFTWYGVLGVNLGKIPQGDYQAKWIVKPLAFIQFEDPANRRASWPKDEHAAEGNAKPKVLATSFTVTAP